MAKPTHDDRIRVETLRKQGFSAKRIRDAYAEKGWLLTAIKRVCQQVDTTGTFVERKSDSGRPRTARSAENIAAVSELICSQDGQVGTHLSSNAAAAVNISHS